MQFPFSLIAHDSRSVLAVKGPLCRFAPCGRLRADPKGWRFTRKKGELFLPVTWFLSEGHQPRSVCNSSFPPSHFLPFNSLDSSWSVMLLMSPMFMVSGPDEPLFIANLNSR